MTKIVSVNAFRGGTGKSNIAANLAVQLTLRARRVAAIDADLTAPGLRTFFGLASTLTGPMLDDYLWDDVAVEDAAYNMQTNLQGMGVETLPPGGALYLLPASSSPDAVRRILREGYDIALLLNDGLRELARRLHLDYLILDAPPGLGDEALLCAGISTLTLVTLRPDEQNFQGTAELVGTLRRLFGEHPLLLAITQMPDGLDAEEVCRRAERDYEADVAAVLPLSEDVARLGSNSLFSPQFPDHPWSRQIAALADRMIRMQ